MSRVTSHATRAARQRPTGRARTARGTLLGALAVGVVESFGSFFSGALKDVIVFSLLIPVLLLRSAMAKHPEEEAEEIDA